jgi:hypothetical protein
MLYTNDTNGKFTRGAVDYKFAREHQRGARGRAPAGGKMPPMTPAVLAWPASFVLLATHAASVTDARLTVETPGPTRVYLTDGAGAPVTLPGVLAYHKGDEHHFIVPGRLEMELPPGRYRVSAERGPEHRPVSLDVQLRAGERRRVELRPERWTDMNARGWYSGDLHNHRNVDEVPTLLLAEDLNLAPTLADWVWEDSQRGQAPVTSDPIRSIDARHAYSVLDKEVERLMEGPGAVDLLGLKSAIPFDGYRLSPPNDVYTAAAHRQGGYVDAEKIVWRDVPVLVALGQIDFAGIVYNHFNRQDVEFETDRWGMIPKWRPEFTTVAGMPLWAMEVYYRFLNCGFRLPASAGSASGVKAAPLGYNRVYVRLDAPFSYAAWFRALKAGRSFATNGPLLFLTVDGREPGAVVKAAGGAKLRVRVEAQSLRPLERVEVIYRGGVIRTLRPPDTPDAPAAPSHLAAEFDFTPETDGWIAARAFERPGRTIRFSHTSPLYLERGVPASAADDARFFLDWIDREIRLYQASTGFRSEADRAAMLDFFAKGRAVYERLAR